MKVILLERIAKLGQIGETVKVKDGFGRNFLLPQGKALRANKENLVRFERERSQIEARNLEQRQEAEKVNETLDGKSFIVVRQAAETGQLYGSVSARDIAEVVAGSGIAVGRNQIELLAPIKTIGIHKVLVALHPEVHAGITINIARSIDEAQRQQEGEVLNQRSEGFVREVESVLEDEGNEHAEL